MADKWLTFGREILISCSTAVSIDRRHPPPRGLTLLSPLGTRKCASSLHRDSHATVKPSSTATPSAHCRSIGHNGPRERSAGVAANPCRACVDPAAAGGCRGYGGSKLRGGVYKATECGSAEARGVDPAVVSRGAGVHAVVAFVRALANIGPSRSGVAIRCRDVRLYFQ